MSAVNSNPVNPKSRSLLADAWVRLKKDRFAVFGFTVVTIYALIAIFAKVGWIATPWDK